MIKKNIFDNAKENSTIFTFIFLLNEFDIYVSIVIFGIQQCETRGGNQKIY